MATATTEAQFDPGSGAGLQFAIHPGITPFGVTKVRQYPDANPILRTNLGFVTREHSETVRIVREVVIFSGSSTASANFPIIANWDLFNFGGFFDEDGNEVQVGFNIKNGTLIATRSFFGAVEISYDTTFRLLRYEGAIFEGVFSVGVILAFLDGNVTTFEIPLPELPEDDFVELYRITSNMVATDDETYEEPTGWTGQPGSPTHPEGLPDGAEANIRVARVHEIGRINSRNTVSKRTFFVEREVPFKGTSTFSRRLTVEPAQVGSGGLTTEQSKHTNAINAVESAIERAKLGG